MFDKFLQLVNDSHINAVDVSAVSGTAAMWFFDLLPKVSALLTVVWIGLRIWILIRDDILNRKDKHEQRSD